MISVDETGEASSSQAGANTGLSSGLEHVLEWIYGLEWALELMGWRGLIRLWKS